MEKISKIRGSFSVFVMSFLIISVIIAGWAKPAVSSSSKVYKWRLQTGDTPFSVSITDTLPAFCDNVRRMSNGRLDISVYSGGQIVKSFEIVNGLKSGMIEMGYVSGAWFLGSVPVCWLDTCNWPPMLVRNVEDLKEIYWYRGVDELFRKGYAKQGTYFLRSTMLGEPITHWSRRPMYGTADLKGYKVRSWGYPSEMLKKLGATPTMIPHSEVYTSLAQGILDGSGTSASYYKRFKFYEVCPYFYLPGWFDRGIMHMLVSMKAWNKLPDDLKAILDAATITFSSDHCHRNNMEFEQMLLEFDQLGATLITWPEEEVNKMKEISNSFMDDWANKCPECAEGVRIIKNYLKETGQLK